MNASEDGLAVELGSLFADVTYDDIDASHRERLIEVVVDVLACGFSGLDTKQHDAVLSLLDDDGADESTVFGADVRASAAEAALANTTTAHILTYDDRHRGSSTHPGSMVVPVALAVGEAVGAAGRDVLTAVFAGYETIGRLGTLLLGFNPDLPRRPTPVFGPIGCAVTAGVLFDLDGTELGNAIGYGANLAGGMSQVWADGTEEYALQAGLAARNGVTAAELARTGLTAAPRTLEGEYGFFRAFYGEVPDDLASVATPLDGESELDDVYPKPVPACGMVVVPIQLAEGLSEDGLRVEDVERMEVTVSGRTANIPGCSYQGPFDSPTRALMSIPFGIASTLVLDGYSWTACTDHHDDPRIQSLVDQIDLEYDDSFSKYRCEITVERTGSETIAVDAETPSGTDADDIEAKFEASVGEHRSAEETTALLEALWELPTAADVSSVVSRFGGR